MAGYVAGAFNSPQNFINSESCFSFQDGEQLDIVKLTERFIGDPHEQKVNLFTRDYKCDEGQPWTLPVVRSVSMQLAGDRTLNHEYLPVEGLADFRGEGIQLLLGDDSLALIQNRVDSIQTIGDIGAIRIGLDFLKSRLGFDMIYFSTPALQEHVNIAKSLGYGAVLEYRYWQPARQKVDFDGMMEDLQNAAEMSVIMLQAPGSSLSGCDLNISQWKQIAKCMKERKLLPFFDCGYLGLSSGSVDTDNEAVRLFVAEGLEIFAAVSFAANFGLYNDAVGQLAFVVGRTTELSKVRSHLKAIARVTWSTPPDHGSRIVTAIVNNPALRLEWKENVRSMAEHVREIRKHFYFKLKSLGTPGAWEHIIQQSGLFTFTGFTARQCDHLLQQYHLYLRKDGCINISAINIGNVDYVAGAFYDVVTNMQGRLNSSL